MGKWFIEAFLVFVGIQQTLTLGFVYPCKILLPENSLMASLLFLPHGVRAIAFFFLGKSKFISFTCSLCHVVHHRPRG